MIIVDVESSGMDARLCSLLSVGALDFDNPENQFYMECYAFPGAHVEKEALAVNGFRREDVLTDNRQPITDNKDSTHPPVSPLERGERKSLPAEAASARAGDSGTPFRKGRIKSTDKEVVCAFLEWLKTCKEWTLAGQNPSFDRNFLEETAHRYHINWPLAHRTIDLHTVCYTEFLKAGKTVPFKHNHSALNLDRILKHVGLPTRTKKHNALEDAKLEAETFSRLVYRKNLLSEYKDFPFAAV